SFHGTSIALPIHADAGPLPSLDMRGSCEVCHTDQRIMVNGTRPPKKTTLELLDYVRKIQDATRMSIVEIQNRGATNQSKDGKTIVQLSNAQANLNSILMDGSMGVHNSRISLQGKVSP